MRWQTILFLSLLVNACDSTGPELQPCMGDTKFMADYSTYLSMDGRTNGYTIKAVLAATRPCYSVDGGRVSFSDTPVPLGPSHGSGPTYILSDSTAATGPFRFDGTVETIAVSGSSGFPPMVDSIQSFSGALEITAPGPFDTIPRDSSLSIIWNPSSREDDSVVILLTGAAAGAGYPGKALRYHVRDNGELLLPLKEVVHRSLVYGAVVCA